MVTTFSNMMLFIFLDANRTLLHKGLDLAPFWMLFFQSNFALILALLMHLSWIIETVCWWGLPISTDFFFFAGPKWYSWGFSNKEEKVAKRPRFVRGLGLVEKKKQQGSVEESLEDVVAIVFHRGYVAAMDHWFQSLRFTHGNMWKFKGQGWWDFHIWILKSVGICSFCGWVVKCWHVYGVCSPNKNPKNQGEDGIRIPIRNGANKGNPTRKMFNNVQREKMIASQLFQSIWG